VGVMEVVIYPSGLRPHATGPAISGSKFPMCYRLGLHWVSWLALGLSLESMLCCLGGSWGLLACSWVVLRVHVLVSRGCGRVLGSVLEGLWGPCLRPGGFMADLGSLLGGLGGPCFVHLAVQGGSRLAPGWFWWSMFCGLGGAWGLPGGLGNVGRIACYEHILLAQAGA